MKTLRKIALVFIFTIGFSTSPLSAHAREYMVGTFAYSFVAEGYPNLFIQGSITERTAWLIDKCDDNGGTVAGLYKNYWKRFSDGPYWFSGLIYIQNGIRRGTSLTAGLGYEHLLNTNVSLGVYAGYAAGDSGQRFGVFNITLAYVFPD